jgi:transcriptional regulator with XRE-family HTH domain
MADTFSDRLREVRAAQGVLANRTGIHHTAIGRFERGDRDPSLKSVLRLARGLGVEPGVLLNGLEADRDA